jgi:hypothetical protein
MAEDEGNSFGPHNRVPYTPEQLEEGRQKGLEVRKKQIREGTDPDDDRPFDDAVLDAERDPLKNMEKVQAVVGVGLRRAMNRWLKSGGTPPRGLLELLREFRKVQRDVNAYIEARGAMAQAGEFFAEVQARIQEAAPRLAASARPLVEPPAVAVERSE